MNLCTKKNVLVIFMVYFICSNKLTGKRNGMRYAGKYNVMYSIKIISSTFDWENVKEILTDASNAI